MSTGGSPWGATLRDLRQQAVEAANLRALRSVARKALQDLPKSVQDFEAARKRVIAGLDKQLETLKSRRAAVRPQGSALSSSSSASASDRRSSVSSAARGPVPAAKAVAAAPARRAAAAVTCQRSPALPYAAVVASPAGSPRLLRSHPSSRVPSRTPPQASPAAGNASKERTATPQPAASAGSPSTMLLETRMRVLEEQVGSLTAQLAAAQRAHAQLQRQVQQTHSAGMATTATLTAVEQQVQKLSAAQQEQAATRDKVSLLQSKQEQLRQRQQQDACARDIVLKCPKPLPAEGTAAHVQQLLTRQLQLSLTVVRVQHLRGSGDSGSSGGSNDSAQRRHAYRISLGSRGERTAVLRTKAQRLRGTDLSIDALLTPDQLASRQQLQPVARQARTAGRTVRWRYGSLLIDGQPYTGPGSMPSPKQPAQPAPQPRPSTSPSSEEREGWQTVQRRRPKGKQQPSATGSKKALFVAAPLKQAGPAGSKPKTTKATKTAAGGSSSGKAASGGIRGQPLPAASGPDEVQRPAPCDHREPPRHRAALRLEPGSLAPGLGERVHDDFLRIGSLADNAIRDRVHECAIPVVEVRHGAFVGGRRPCHELAVSSRRRRPCAEHRVPSLYPAVPPGQAAVTAAPADRFPG